MQFWIWIFSLYSVVYAVSKDQFCAHNYGGQKEALDLIRVPSISSTKYPRILCIVNTISTHHATHVQAIIDTWGKQCDTLVFASNLTDTSLGTVAIDTPLHDHNHLWQKHKATLKYIYAQYGNTFDWFYKSDDDAFVIVDNLKEYLRTPKYMTKMFSHPITFGHRFQLPEAMLDYYIVDKELRAEFKSKFKKWIFNSGGPGYAMNRMYLEKVLDSVHEHTCLSSRWSTMLPDDASISFCMAWNDAFPYDTRDLNRKERFHADSPKGAYHSPIQPKDYWGTSHAYYNV